MTRYIVVILTALTIAACGSTNPSTPSGTSTEKFDRSKPLDVISASTSPGNGNLTLWQDVSITYKVWCADQNAMVGTYLIRDDGQRRPDTTNLASCKDAHIGTATTGGPLTPYSILYKFGHGHTVAMRLAIAPDVISFEKGLNLTVSDTDIVRWSIVDSSPMILGHVSDASTTRDVSGATVEIIDGPNRGNRTVTGEYGLYALPNVKPEEPFTLRFTHPNYKTTEKSGKTATEDTGVDVALVPVASN